ncbi:hypothetical protein R3I94_002646 [Phoxinus phoxinus]
MNSILNYFPKEPTDSNSEARRASQTGENVQKRIITSKNKGNNGRDPLKERKNDFNVKEDNVKEGPSKSHMQQCDEGQSHSFNFRYKFKKHAVACDTSKNLIDALNTNKIFKNIEKENMGKEIIIKRSKGEVPRAAVKTDFPCCLIEKDELLDITFIKNTGNVDTKKKKTLRLSFSNESENIVIFYIKTKGGNKVKRLMKNNELRKKVEDVCVYALKEEKLRNALRRDGRFINVIFDKQCALRELGSEINHVMSSTVEHLDRKHFEIIVISDKNEPESQEDVLSDVSSTEVNEASAADLKENVDPIQHPVNTEQEETQKRNTMKSTNTSAKYSTIIDSEEILGILRDQFKGLMETLKQRENLKNKTQVQKFFRQEYDKSVESFSEVYKIKQLMRLSDSVCQIRVEGYARGTGFLLFGQFILTNGHVVREFLESPNKLSSTKSLEAAFDFERLDSKVKLVRVKKQIAAYCYITDADNRRLDFALLELEAGDDEIAGRPELLRHYSPGPLPSRGGICIVGHPEGGIKRMDPCFIIGKDKTQEAADKHVSENRDFINVMTQRSLEDRWDIYENQIHYNSCFFYGSSGSPVFDEDCYLTGVHTGGYVYKGEKGQTRSIVEYAYSMQPILEMIKAQARIRGSHDIVNILEAYSNKSYEYGTADQEIQADYEMEESD